ncbi:MAG: elongation factor G [Bacteroidales bacterium]|nr:elongation factor G [Bacteroidales bacterium]
MKTYPTKQIRNIVLLGNAGSGKTTLSEDMLYQGGVIERKGSVESKNTISDYNEVEQENLNSVFSSLLYTEFKDHKINVIDAPGADEFIGQVTAGFNAADSALMLINAQNGVEVGTEIHSRYCEHHEMPFMIVVNHLDHEKANFEKTLENIHQNFGPHAVVTQYPVNAGTDFDSIVDVIKMKMYKYNKDNNAMEEQEIPEDQKAQAEEYHNALVEAAAENDEQLMEQFFEKETLDEQEMLQGIKEGIAARGMFPIFCTASEKGIGVPRLLEFIIGSAPSPMERPTPKTTDGKEVPFDSNGPTSLFFFKTFNESHIGDINYFKVMSGTVREGMDLINATTQGKERLSQIYAAAGKKRAKVQEMTAGDLGAAVKLKETKINHTLNEGKTGFQFPSIEFPEPKYRTAIRVLNESDEEKLGEELSRMHQIDPTIEVEYSKELKQIILHGQGEHQLNILKWHLDNIAKIETEFIAPKIPYRETITKVAQSSHRHKKQSGGAGQFGEVYMVIEPHKEDAPDPTSYKVNGSEISLNVRDKQEYDLQWGGKLVFYNCIVGGAIDAKFMPAILKGIMEKMENGPLTGSYARDIRVAVYDGKMHPVDSNEVSFKLAGRNAFDKAFKNAGPKIMEPVYYVEVLVPSDRMGDVMSDLQGRRAMVEGMDSEKGFEKIRAKVPLSEMHKYSTSLGSLTGGRATYTMSFSEYQQVPPDLQEKLIKDFEAQKEEEE